MRLALGSTARGHSPAGPAFSGARIAKESGSAQELRPPEAFCGTPGPLRMPGQTWARPVLYNVVCAKIRRAGAHGAIINPPPNLVQQSLCLAPPTSCLRAVSTEKKKARDEFHAQLTLSIYCIFPGRQPFPAPGPRTGLGSAKQLHDFYQSSVPRPPSIVLPAL